MANQKPETIGAYEKAVMKFFLFGTLSEISKSIIFYILFYAFGLHREFIASLIFLMAFRIFSGGIHFRKYIHCLLFSFGVFAVNIVLGKYIIIPKFLGVILSLICIAPIYGLTPVQAKTRPKATQKIITNAKRKELIVIMAFVIIYLANNTNVYMNIGLWMLIIHAIQLGVAYIRR